MRQGWLVMLVASGCGRLGFEQLPDGGAATDGATGPDGPGSIPAIVSSASGALDTVTSLTISLTPTGSGHLLVVTTGSHSVGQPITAVFDDAGNTYVSANAMASWNPGGADIVEIWYAKNSKPDATALTVTSATACNHDVWFLEASGMHVTDPLDVVATLSDAVATTVPAATPVTPTTSRSLVVSVADVTNGVSGIDPSSPFQALATLHGNNTAFYVASAPGSYGAVWDDPTIGSYGASTAAFKPAP